MSTSQLTVRIDKELHTRLNVYCAVTNKKVKDVISEYIKRDSDIMKIELPNIPVEA